MRKWWMIMMMLSSLYADQDFERYCVSCHEKLPVSFDMFYMEYLINFSSDMRIKEAMFYYLRDPKKEQSMMDKRLIKELGVMKKVSVTDEKLKALIEAYLDQYSVKKRLR